MYGHKKDLITILDTAHKKEKQGSFHCGRCPCLLDNDVGECLVNQSVKLDSGGFGNIPPGRIIIIVDDSKEFSKAYKAFLDSTGKEDSKCTTAELCIDSKGKASFGLECEGNGFEVSTSGEVKVTIKDITVPLIKGN